MAIPLLPLMDVLVMILIFQNLSAKTFRYPIHVMRMKNYCGRYSEAMKVLIA